MPCRPTTAHLRLVRGLAQREQHGRRPLVVQPRDGQQVPGRGAPLHAPQQPQRQPQRAERQAAHRAQHGRHVRRRGAADTPAAAGAALRACARVQAEPGGLLASLMDPLPSAAGGLWCRAVLPRAGTTVIAAFQCPARMIPKYDGELPCGACFSIRFFWYPSESTRARTGRWRSSRADFKRPCDLALFQIALSPSPLAEPL
jgi:hypothetical protein